MNRTKLQILATLTLLLCVVTAKAVSYATLPTNLNQIMLELSGDFTDDNENTTIEEIEFKTGSFLTSGTLISNEGSPIYAQYNSSQKKITLHTDAQAYMMMNGSYFRNLKSLKNIVGLNMVNTVNMTSMSQMFEFCSSLTSLDVSNFNTQNVTNMSGMFTYCTALTSLDVSNFNTQKVTDMSWMFCDCTSLTSLDLSNFNTQKVTNMRNMFQDCSSMTSLNVSNFNTQKVTNMSMMFQYCSSMTSFDISNFNTQNVTTMFQMFAGCSALISLDLSNFNTQNVTNLVNLFSGCSALTSLDVSSFNTQNVTTMFQMFLGCSSLTSLDISHFNTQNMENMENMFWGCSALKYINICPNLSATGDLNSNAIVTCPEDTYETYANDSFWGQYQVVKLTPTAGGTFGDVNNDTDTDVQDLYYVAKGIMAQKDASIYFMSADVNQDKELTAADYVGITNIILGRNISAAKGVSRPDETQYGDDILSATVSDGAMSIALDNMRGYTAMQMDVTLPEGAAIQKAVRSERLTASHNVTVTQLADNKWRVLLTSAQNATMKGFNGELFSLTLNDAENAKSATIDNILLVEPTMATQHLSAVEATSETTGIVNASAERNAEDVVYGIDGIRHYSLKGVKSGIYVRGGKKVMVK